MAVTMGGLSGSGAGNKALLITGIGAYALGGPIVHLAHDKPAQKFTTVSWILTPMIDPKRNAAGMALQGTW